MVADAQLGASPDGLTRRQGLASHFREVRFRRTLVGARLDPRRAQFFYDQLLGLKLDEVRTKIVELLACPGTAAQTMLGPEVETEPPLQSEPRPIEHVVRYYEKGTTPIEYIPSRQWFVRLMDKKPFLQEVGARVQWLPRVHAEAIRRLDRRPSPRLGHQHVNATSASQSRFGTQSTRTATCSTTTTSLPPTTCCRLTRC